MKPADLLALRQRLGVDRAAFAQIVGTNTRTVIRWEESQCEPTGSSLCVLRAIHEALLLEPERADEIIKTIVDASAIGGLTYLLLKLLVLRPRA